MKKIKISFKTAINISRIGKTLQSISAFLSLIAIPLFLSGQYVAVIILLGWAILVAKVDFSIPEEKSKNMIYTTNTSSPRIEKTPPTGEIKAYNT